MYFVVDSTEMSAPNSMGLCSTGVRKVLSTASRMLCRRAISAMAAISLSFIVGLPGVSTKMIRVCGVMARSTSSGFEVSTEECVTPSPSKTSRNSRTVPPYTMSEMIA